MDTRRELSEAVCTEAAGWVARLHGPHRTPAAEAGFRRWLAESPKNAQAFEFLTEVWDSSGRLRRRPMDHIDSWQFPAIRVSLARAAAVCAAVAVLAVIGTLFYIPGSGISTGVGEQRTVVLEDGTRVHLNTNTRAIIRFDDSTRLVELRKGEALFEVARRADRPFIVQAGDRQVHALGTAFVVRRESGKLAVTLMEGKVAVGPISGSPAALTEMQSRRSVPPNQNATVRSTQSEVFTLSPGQRVTFAQNQSPMVDSPQISKLTAWRRGQVDLEKTLLADAVAEMNRYSNKRITIEDSRAAKIRVSGLFGVADTENFVEAVAHAYQLEIRRTSGEIVLAGPGVSEQ